MKTANYSEFRADLKKYLDSVENDHETLIYPTRLILADLSSNLLRDFCVGKWLGRLFILAKD